MLSMQELLIRAGCFVGIIILGVCLRKIGIFKESDFRVLSNVVMKITLPCAIITSFVGKTIDPAMLTIALLGFLGGITFMLAGFLLNLRRSREEKSFDLMNMSGYNIGCFTLPFVQSFLGSMGAITGSLFDTGNAFICLGTSYGSAAMVKDGAGFSVKRLASALLKSVPFICYVLMLIISLAGIQIPMLVVEFAEIAGSANPFMAMLMIGVGFKLSCDKGSIGRILKILVPRYAISAAMAVCFYFLMPFSIEIRRALVILCFSPVSSALPAFTAELKGDVGLSSAVNSISIICSIIIIVILLSVMLY